MSEYLRTHPNVFMSVPKEPHFFAPDIRSSPYVKDFQEYLDLFRTATQEKKVIGEASVEYLMSRNAPKEIATFSPSAHILVMLRNPSDLVRAFHGQLVKHGQENVIDFEEAWNLQSARSRGKNIPSGCRLPVFLQYRKIGELGTQLQHLMSIFPRERIHIILFDDFVANPAVEYKRLLSFLELPDDNRLEFPHVNEAIQYKWLWLGQFPKRLRWHVTKPLATLRRKTGLRGTGLLKTIDRFNAVPAQRPPLRPEFQRHLTEVFGDEVRLLEELLDQDLSSWREE